MTTTTVLLTPTNGAQQTAQSWARVLGWTVAASLTDPTRAASMMTGYHATTVLTTLDLLTGIGPESTRALIDQINSAGGELHAVPTSTGRPRMIQPGSAP